MSFMANNTEYSIVTNAEVTDVLAHFSDEMILDILDRNLTNRLSYVPKVNIVESLEFDFKKCLDLYPAYSDDIYKTRFHVYSIIIDTICTRNHIQSADIQYGSDIYTQAYFLYDLLVSNFTNNVVNFFANYILREKNSLYDLMDQDLLSKNKGFNTIYSKKMFKNGNSKFITLHANLEYVVDNICAFDIDFDTYASCVYTNSVVSNYLNMITTENSGELFQTQIVPFVMMNKAIILTYIKLALQSYIKSSPDELIKED